jgi:hypothetical protein
MNARDFVLGHAYALESWDAARLQDLALDAGLSFSIDELNTAADELWGALSEETLRGIVGGGAVRSQERAGSRTEAPAKIRVRPMSCYFWRPR